MSPRRAAVLRDGDRSLREHLIATVARLLSERGSSGSAAGLTVRDIAREAKVADGVLYNHFEDKEELIALGLGVHVGRVMREAIDGLPRQAGQGTVQDNLRAYIDQGLAVLTGILPIFAGLLSQPKVLLRFHATPAHGPADQGGLPGILGEYLAAEQALGRVAAGVDPRAAARMVIGACHDLVLPHLLSSQQAPVQVPPGFADGIVRTLWQGISPARPLLTEPATESPARPAAIEERPVPQ